MTHESYCAAILEFQESERFMAVGDEALARLLNPRRDRDLAEGKEPSLPDLLSVKEVDGKVVFRLREMKFKLEKRLIAKALSQLESGLRKLREAFPGAIVDRVELAVALRQRDFKEPEKKFLGESVGPNRFVLKMDDAVCFLPFDGALLPTTVVAL